MTARHELLYDTAAALRLVDGEVRAMTADAAPLAGLASLPLVFERINDEIQAVLSVLHESRAALESAAVDTLQHTNQQLQEVTSATEVAATDLLDALERAGRMIDDLDAADDADDRPRARQTRERLREELFGMVGALQFQDITTQQLAYAASVLCDMEGRVLHIAQLFDPASIAVRATVNPGPRTFDPRATTRDAERRQALADAIFLGER